MYIHVYINYNNKKHFLKKMKCDVGLMIDRDVHVAEKRYENKVGMSS